MNNLFNPPKDYNPFAEITIGPSSKDHMLITMDDINNCCNNQQKHYRKLNPYERRDLISNIPQWNGVYDMAHRGDSTLINCAAQIYNNTPNNMVMTPEAIEWCSEVIYNKVISTHKLAPILDPYNTELYFVRENTMYYNSYLRQMITPSPGKFLIVPAKDIEYSNFLIEAAMKSTINKVRARAVKKHKSAITSRTVLRPYLDQNIMGNTLLKFESVDISGTHELVNKMVRKCNIIHKFFTNIVQDPRNMDRQVKSVNGIYIIQLTEADFRVCDNFIWNFDENRLAEVGECISMEAVAFSWGYIKANVTILKSRITKKFNADARYVRDAIMNKDVTAMSDLPPAEQKDAMIQNLKTTRHWIDNIDLIKKQISAMYACTVIQNGGLYTVIDNNVDFFSRGVQQLPGALGIRNLPEDYQKPQMSISYTDDKWVWDTTPPIPNYPPVNCASPVMLPAYNDNKMLFADPYDNRHIVPMSEIKEISEYAPTVKPNATIAIGCDISLNEIDTLAGACGLPTLTDRPDMYQLIVNYGAPIVCEKIEALRIIGSNSLYTQFVTKMAQMENYKVDHFTNDDIQVIPEYNIIHVKNNGVVFKPMNHYYHYPNRSQTIDKVRYTQVENIEADRLVTSLCQLGKQDVLEYKSILDIVQPYHKHMYDDIVRKGEYVPLNDEQRAILLAELTYVEDLNIDRPLIGTFKMDNGEYHTVECEPGPYGKIQPCEEIMKENPKLYEYFFDYSLMDDQEKYIEIRQKHGYVDDDKCYIYPKGYPDGIYYHDYMEIVKSLESLPKPQKKHLKNYMARYVLELGSELNMSGCVLPELELEYHKLTDDEKWLQGDAIRYIQLFESQLGTPDEKKEQFSEYKRAVLTKVFFKSISLTRFDTTESMIDMLETMHAYGIAIKKNLRITEIHHMEHINIQPDRNHRDDVQLLVKIIRTAFDGKYSNIPNFEGMGKYDRLVNPNADFIKSTTKFSSHLYDVKQNIEEQVSSLVESNGRIFERTWAHVVRVHNLTTDEDVTLINNRELSRKQITDLRNLQQRMINYDINECTIRLFSDFEIKVLISNIDYTLDKLNMLDLKTSDNNFNIYNVEKPFVPTQTDRLIQISYACTKPEELIQPLPQRPVDDELTIVLSDKHHKEYYDSEVYLVPSLMEREPPTEEQIRMALNATSTSSSEEEYVIDYYSQSQSESSSEEDFIIPFDDILHHNLEWESSESCDDDANVAMSSEYNLMDFDNVSECEEFGYHADHTNEDAYLAENNVLDINNSNRLIEYEYLTTRERIYEETHSMEELANLASVVFVNNETDRPLKDMRLDECYRGLDKMYDMKHIVKEYTDVRHGILTKEYVSQYTPYSDDHIQKHRAMCIILHQATRELFLQNEVKCIPEWWDDLMNIEDYKLATAILCKRYNKIITTITPLEWILSPQFQTKHMFNIYNNNLSNKLQIMLNTYSHLLTPKLMAIISRVVNGEISYCKYIPDNNLNKFEKRILTRFAPALYDGVYGKKPKNYLPDTKYRKYDGHITFQSLSPMEITIGTYDKDDIFYSSNSLLTEDDFEEIDTNLINDDSTVSYIIFGEALKEMDSICEGYEDREAIMTEIVICYNGLFRSTLTKDCDISLVLSLSAKISRHIRKFVELCGNDMPIIDITPKTSVLMDEIIYMYNDVEYFIETIKYGEFSTALVRRCYEPKYFDLLTDSEIAHENNEISNICKDPQFITLIQNYMFSENVIIVECGINEYNLENIMLKRKELKI